MDIDKEETGKASLESLEWTFFILKMEPRDEDDQSDEYLENSVYFVYQSPEMKRIYIKYAPHMVFLHATYKTSKYALALFFLVVP